MFVIYMDNKNGNDWSLNRGIKIPRLKGLFFTNFVKYFNFAATLFHVLYNHK